MPTRQKRKAVPKKHSITTRPTRIDFENVSDRIVHECVEILGPLDAQKILICVGTGETGALGLAAAVKLGKDGARPTILLSGEENNLTDEGRVYLKQAEVTRVNLRAWTPNLPTSVYEQDLIIDALLGAGTDGNPRYPLDQIIKSINDSRSPVLALDLPSGLDPQSGQPGRPTVVAMVTLPISVATEKFLNKDGALFVGKVAANS